MTMLDKMMTIIAILSLSFSGLTLVGCEQEGPFERAGERTDDAVDDIGDGLEDAGDEIEDGIDDLDDDFD